VADLDITRATEADVSAVASLAERCKAEMQRRGIDQWDELYPTRERFSADAAASSLYVASLGPAAVIGAFTLDRYQDVEYAAVPWAFRDEPVGVVHRLMVDPRFQGRGIAQELMRFAERVACNLGCAVMRLDAFASNPRALGLYRGLGYREAGGVRFRKGAFRCFEKRLATTRRR
jgi:ribosomal protein S18 acetylase RimI-like enzyme